MSSLIESIFILSTLNGELGPTPTDQAYANACEAIFNNNDRRSIDSYEYYIKYKDGSKENLVLLYLDTKNRLCVNTTAYFNYTFIETYCALPKANIYLGVLPYEAILPKGVTLYFRHGSIFKAPKRYAPFMEFNGWTDMCHYLLSATGDNEALLDEYDFIFIPKHVSAKTNDGYYVSYVSDVYKLDTTIKLVGSFATII